LATDAAARAPLELTLRGVLLGAVITYAVHGGERLSGLKVGLTFATSIPAAVISMAILRFFRGATILENNIVQTIASAAGTLAAIVFVLPGLIMVGWWRASDIGPPLLGAHHRRHIGRDVLGAAAPRARDRLRPCPIPRASPPPKCSRSARTAAGESKMPRACAC
jgi:hypothetical protein